MIGEFVKSTSCESFEEANGLCARLWSLSQLGCI
jgi:hypothetical protein